MRITYPIIYIAYSRSACMHDTGKTLGTSDEGCSGFSGSRIDTADTRQSADHCIQDTTVYVDAFCEVLRENGISCQVEEVLRGNPGYIELREYEKWI